MKTKKEIMAEGFQDFSSQTTIHGLNIIGMPKLHIFERILWIFIVSCALVAAISLTLSSLKRYSENPTVVSLEKDYRNWMNPFPAVTGCFVNKTNLEKVADYIKTRWGVTDSDEKFGYYSDFVTIVANTSYETLYRYEKFMDDQTLNNIDLLELSSAVHPNLVGTLVTFEHKRKPKWSVVITEMGICFTVNSKFAPLLKIKNQLSNETDDSDEIHILRCHYLNGLCYARYDSDPTLAVKYYIHSYLDILHATSDEPVIVEESQEMDISFRMQETTSSASLKDLSPLQRGCRFYDEPLNPDLKVYSTSLCYMQCREEIALKLCGCTPFFYIIGRRGKTCDIKGMVCLSKNLHILLKNPSELNCVCPQACHLITYIKQVPKVTKWEYGYFDQRITFRWGLIPPTTKYIRDVIFGIDSLVASSGGTVSLFLGMSVIGLIEFFYLILENLVKCCIRFKRNKKVKTNGRKFVN
ncbi:sodium channel protein Nach-like [Coccinella septempunctata]|uniref:sodium channel protein Nach-like n=1 Tax=Coccinella septempunctata TaxID=41139 RepID=UPI001D089FB8|nr:sodium channel protein Nach-like [Coccinella septempunctata]